MIALATLLSVTARAFGVPEAGLRLAGDERGAEARAAFCYLASALTPEDDLAIGLAAGLRPEAVELEREALAGRLNVVRALDETLFVIEVEARALAALSARIGVRSPPAASPFALARKFLGSERAAMAATVDEVQAMAAALMALAGTKPRDKSALVLAAEAAERAGLTLANALYTKNEAPARRERADAIEKLKQLIGA